MFWLGHSLITVFDKLLCKNMSFSATSLQEKVNSDVIDKNDRTVVLKRNSLSHYFRAYNFNIEAKMQLTIREIQTL